MSNLDEDEEDPIQAARRLSLQLDSMSRRQSDLADRIARTSERALSVLTSWDELGESVHRRSMAALQELRDEGVLSHSNEGVKSIVHTAQVWGEFSERIVDNDDGDGWLRLTIPWTDLAMAMFASSSPPVRTLRHKSYSSFEECGVQLWQGSLLLLDYVIHNYNSSSGCATDFIELGCGLGLIGITLSQLLSMTTVSTVKVVMTDYDALTKEACQMNIKDNNMTTAVSPELVHLDWTQPETYPWKCRHHDLCSPQQHFDVLLAADITYDDDMKHNVADVLVSFFFDQQINHHRYAIVSMEVRQLYTSGRPEDAEFRDLLASRGLAVEVLEYNDETLPLYTKYKRTDVLQLWKIH
eukprot:PhM_4_TR595/c0_g1_i1/m.12288